MDPKITKFWTSFGAILGSILGPKIAPKGDQKWDQFLNPKPRAEGKAETGSVYRGCTFCAALCCFKLLWAALDHFGLLGVAL